MVPGSGLCPGFTTSFAILSDAVALVRGDRFYTVDYNPSNLTSFGWVILNLACIAANIKSDLMKLVPIMMSPEAE